MVLRNPNQRTEVSSDSVLPVHSCRGVFDALLPHSITESLSTGNNGPFQIQACTYGGSTVSFEINSTDESCLLKITNTGSVRSMVEIMSLICCRCQGREVSRFPAEVATSLQVFTATCVCLVSSLVFLHSMTDEIAAIAGKLSDLLLSSPAPARIHDLMLEIFAVFCCICRLR